ncbi:periplasmic binding protein family protein [Burkholderia pseudomallei MSHR449]|nr:periplasmic binding protein family protein [Burkholderia pseudomallei MSHR449]
MRKRPDALRPHRSVPFGLATETGLRNKPTEPPSGTGMRKRASTVRGGTGIGFAPARGFAWLARRRTATRRGAQARAASRPSGHAGRGASPRAAAPAQASPPFARSTCALTQPPSGPARNDTTPAMSSGSPRRSSGGIFA